jgi:hypothetical protein
MTIRQKVDNYFNDITQKYENRGTTIPDSLLAYNAIKTQGKRIAEEILKEIPKL